MKKKNESKLVKEIEGFNDIVEQTFYLEQKVNEHMKVINSNKNKISRQMGRKSKLDVRVDEQLAFTVYKDVETDIKFHVDQLAQTLDKDNYKRVTNKTLTIKNFNSLVKMLKNYGVDPREFKNFVDVKREANPEEIDHLIEIGELEIDKLQGCYTATFDETIKVNRKSPKRNSI